jgi:hypothetical protein
MKSTTKKPPTSTAAAKPVAKKQILPASKPVALKRPSSAKPQS